MFPSPPVTFDRIQLRLWAADALQVRGVTAEDAPAIHDVEDAARQAGDSWRQGVLETVLLHVRNLQEAKSHGHGEAAPDTPGESSADQETTQVTVLKHLAASACPLRPKDLATLLGVSREHVARTLSGLVKDSLAVRVSPADADGRATGYKLTEDGETVLARLNERPDLGKAAAVSLMEEQFHRLMVGDLIAGQQWDRRAEKPDAVDLTRTETALSFARELRDPDLYLRAAHEHLTSLRHRDQVGDAELALVFVAALRRDFPGPLTTTRERELAALERYHRERVSLMKTSPGRNRLDPHAQRELLLEADDTLSQTNGAIREEVGVWLANALSKLALDRGQSITAAKHAMEAVARSNSKDWFPHVTVRTRLASIWRLQGRADQAIESLTDTLRLLKEKDPEHEFDLLMAECLYQRGEARRYRGQLAYGQRDLEDAARYFEQAGARGRRSRLFSFTGSALLAAAYDRAPSSPRSESVGASYIQGFTEMFEDDSLAPDVRALTCRRLAVALRRTDAQQAYEYADEAARLYAGVSLVGELEARVSAAASSPTPLSELELVPDLLDTILDVAESPSRNDPGSDAVLLVDIWTRQMITGILSREDSPALELKLKDQWGVLEEAGLALRDARDDSGGPQPIHRHQLGGSAMGKEPQLLVAAA